MKSVYRLVCTAAAIAMLQGVAPVYAEVVAAPKPAAVAQPVPVTATEQLAVNINSAGAEEIANTLSGVGLTKAQAIVVWREQNGSFNSIEQLTEVKGIGEGILAKNRDRIVLN